MELTNEQKIVISAAPADRQLVLAGPGTGKTEVVARRLAFLLSNFGVKPSQILVLSFSRAAVKALVSRIRELGETESGIIEDLRYLSVRTFDSWTFRVLRLLGEDPSELLRREYDKNIINLTELIHVEGLSQLEQRSSAPFSRYRHVIVDEAQDLTGPRADLVQAMLENLVPTCQECDCGFTILGDIDQSIYDWTSQEDENHLSSRELVDWIVQEYGDSLRKVRLEKNHRSDSQLASLCREASILLREDDRDVRPDLATLLSEYSGNRTFEEVVSMLREENDSSLAVLCRDNSQVLELAMALREEIDPAHFAKLSLLAGSPSKILPPWVAILLHPVSSRTITRSQFARILKEQPDSARQHIPCDGDVETTWSLLLRFAKVSPNEMSISMERLRERISWPDSLPDDEGAFRSPLVLSTIHQSKGLEFDQVCLVPRANEDDDDDEKQTNVGEEARVTYVGMSRAREDLAILEVEQQTRPFRQIRKGSRTRWHRWFKTKKGGSFNHLEIGIDGDVEGVSFVDMELHCDAAHVAEVQNLLLKQGANLIGKKVVLTRMKLPGKKLKFAYEINLQASEDSSVLLGRTSDQLTWDILSAIPDKQTLPKNIYELRVGGLTTITAPKTMVNEIPEPWKCSGLWLGIAIHGIGQFMSYWKSSRK